jgi:hypothetical protein
MAAPALRMIGANGHWWMREAAGFESRTYEEVADLERYRFALMRL